MRRVTSLGIGVGAYLARISGETLPRPWPAYDELAGAAAEADAGGAATGDAVAGGVGGVTGCSGSHAARAARLVRARRARSDMAAHHTPSALHSGNARQRM